MARKTPAKDPSTGKFVKSEDTTENDDIDYKKDIQDKSFNAIATETPDEETTTETTETPEVTTEIKKETPKDEEIEFDPKKFKEEVVSEISSKVSQETADKIAQTLTGKDKATETQKDKYEAYAEKFAAEKGRQPTWFEVAAFIKDEVKAEAVAEQQAKVKEQEARTQETQEQQKQRTVAFNKYLDEQLDDLYKSKRLPQIVDKNNEQDQGVVFRKALFKTMMDVNTTRVKEGKQPIYSIKEIFYEHFKAPNAQPAGADAPVSAGMRSTGHAANEEQEYSYADVHKKGFLDLLMGK
jgi:hypothetical protein